MGDEQLSMDLGVEQTAWGKWVDSERRRAQAQKFMDYAGISEIPSEPWPEDSPEIERLDRIVAELFPDLSTAMAPETADMADAFICFMGECFAIFTGAQWRDAPWFGREYSFYDDINPALEYGFADADADTAWGLMKSAIGGGFSRTAALMRELAARYTEDQDERS
ncbi:hypothetical protein [Nocardia brasiliensis]|uniref:hypothetical protein n=1 Tax=Nocardia brasiliensis TaxID=37326 RepID=UPI0018951CB2|nr:hypothetical protein [Nocardia brasiliensis]MBF6131142.1 hypothetical protein [Nocardia brasiliensis]